MTLYDEYQNKIMAAKTLDDLARIDHEMCADNGIDQAELDSLAYYVENRANAIGFEMDDNV